jgi:hypothetical protein
MTRLALNYNEKKACPSLGINGQRLNGFEKELGIQLRLISQKDKKIERLESEIAKLKQDSFKKIFEPKIARKVPVKERDSDGQFATTRDLNRVILIVNEDLQTKTDIRRITIIPAQVLDNALSFLVKNNIVEEVRQGSIFYYRRKK